MSKAAMVVLVLFLTSAVIATANPVPSEDLYISFDPAGPASICIFDHPDYPHWVVDCTIPEGQVWLCEATVSGRITGGDGICEQAAPVEDVTWSAIKAMYRE